MGRLDGKIAFITGAARGQGRSHAVRFAEEGADIIAFDICNQVETAPYPMSTPNDLTYTVELVESLNRRIIARQGDTRDGARIQEVVDEGLAKFGAIDIAVANAGIAGVGCLWELDERSWRDVVEINLSGTWKTMKAVAPAMIERRQGSIIVTGSTGSIAALPRLGHYTAAKHGVIGLVKAFAVELAPYRVRANAVNPGNVNSPMINNLAARAAFTGSADITAEQFSAAMQANNALPVPWVEVRDVSNAMLYLASDESRFVTGTQHVVDAGSLLPVKVPQH
ncbi:mycofactocin-coupled SDR family oxidoreductase [Pseudonocardia yunnanensis]|uniref:Mycofactocin-coupled SDR family oxidoreductase n=1 Tax=Pseudonocardia yunnanensis TaxID=58107 RepID=A0ABW4F0R6_9PSEU